MDDYDDSVVFSEWCLLYRFINGLSRPNECSINLHRRLIKARVLGVSSGPSLSPKEPAKESLNFILESKPYSY